MTPNDTQRHFSARIWAFWAPGHCAIQPVRTVPKHLSSQTCLRVGHVFLALETWDREAALRDGMAGA